MNGKGERFKKAGFNIPKPLLPLPDGILWNKVSETYKMMELPCILLPRRDQGETVVPAIPFDTSGPLETVLCAKGVEKIQEDLLIADCDSFFENPQELWDAVEEFRKSNAGGGVTVRKVSNEKVSSCIIEDGFATKFSDNLPSTAWSYMSYQGVPEWSPTGPYYWKSWDTFYKCALQAYWDGVTSIAPVYNYLKEPVRAVEVKSFVHLGTPDAYVKYCRSKLSELETPST